ncbi:EAL domain-containing protein [Mesobacillus zeae]|uniref:EAL domain-containing protein n=1 Tax=Mesobacillus zeae TaxID=1917180 RepID=A0A398B9N7_9BACI|nr:EAL domain-containing protein [Mesobacillus zeae]RID84426.1 EAL domain-containing protein [Mesobacillus zeae]
MEKSRFTSPKLIFVILFTAAYYAWLLASNENFFQRQLGGNLFSIAAPCIGSYWLVKAGKRAGRKEYLFWIFLALGTFSNAAAESVWLYYDNFARKDVPQPGLSDLFYFLQYVFYLLSFFYRIVFDKKYYKGIRFLVDVLIVMAAAVAFSWLFLIHPILSDPEVSGFLMYVNIAYPAGDLAILFGSMVLYLGCASRGFRQGMIFLFTGMITQTFADSAYLYLSAIGTYTSGSYIDPLFSLALLMIGYGGELNSRPEGSGIGESDGVDEPRGILSQYLPFVTMLMLIFFIILKSGVNNPILIGVGASIFLLVVRQVVILIENGQLVQKYLERTKELAINKQRYKSLFDYHSDAIFSIDLNGKFTSVNHAYSMIAGYRREELVEKSILEIVDTQLAEKIKSYLGTDLKKSSQTIEVTTTKNGYAFHTIWTTVPIKVDGEVVGIYGIGKDVTEKKDNEQKITFMAYHDLLTGLPNRSLFKKGLDEAMEVTKTSGEKMAVMFLDLDRFKIVNDTLGHNTGDELLIAVSERLQGCLDSRSLIARQGGDEFTILARELASWEDAGRIAKRINEALNQPFKVFGHELRVSPSIGIALYPEDDKSAEGLMKKADMAMYKAKDQGKNRYCFYTDDLQELPARKLVLVRDLHRAIEKEEFEIHYQLQIDRRSGGYYGAEALIRWNHPSMGMIPPGEFISIAEETGMIVPIGDYVLREACSEAVKWHKAGSKIKIGVNLSPKQFYQHALVENIEKVLDQTGLDPRFLDLEITEGIAMNDYLGTVPHLSRLRQIGAKISIDDFGTGYSSLSYLTNLPIDTLKIAREFISRIGKDPANEAIIASIINMAGNLGLEVVAEGVETENQAVFLENLGCSKMQGFLFSRPARASITSLQLNGEVRI